MQAKGRKKTKKKTLSRIGWREWLALPTLGIERIKAKVDTGARTSSLHAFDIRIVEVDGEERVRFKVHPRQRDHQLTIETEAPLLEHRTVRPSTGVAKSRPVIRIDAVLGNRRWPIEVTLVRRDMMGFRMLLGRHAVRNRYLIHAGRSFLAGSPSLAPAPNSPESTS